MSKAELPSHLFDDKGKILFDYLPIPSYAWQILNEDKNEDFILINYNHAAHEITAGTIEDFVGIKASDLYKDQPEILDDLKRCSRDRSNFFKEMKYQFKSSDSEKFLSVNYGYIPPDIVIVHTNNITEKRKAETKNAEMELELKKSEKELKKLNYELEQKIEERTKDLKKSEQRYRLITENVNDMVAILNEEQRYEYINEGIHNQLRGTSNELLIGTSPLDIVHPDEVEMNKKSFKKTLKEGEGVLETRIRNLWGGYNWFEVKGKTFIDVDGKKKVLLIARDITERKENELLLKQSERKYRHLFENSPYRIVLINTDGKIIDYNSLTSNLMSNNKIDIIGKDFRDLEFITQNNLQILKKMFTDLHIKGFTNAVEMDFGKESNLGWANLHASIVQIDNQKIIQVLVEDINERKKAEVKLKESEQKHRLITENINDLIGIINDQFKFEYFNEKILGELSGFTSEERIGRVPFEFIHPEDVEKAKKILIRAFKTGEGMVELRFKKKDLNYIWLEVKGKTFIDIDGSKKLLVISRDITERKKAEEKLKDSEEKYRNMIFNLDVGFFKTDTKGIFLTHNPALNKILGFNPSKNLIGLSAQDFWENSEDLQNFYQSLVKNEVSRNFIHKAKKKNGDIIFLQVDAHLIKDKENNILEMEGTVSDITEKYILEQKLKESEEIYRTITEQSFLGIAIMQDNLIKYVNNQLAELFGRPVEEVIRWKASEFLNVIHPDDRLFVAEQARKKQLGESDVISQYKFRGIKKNGDIIWLETYSKTINYQGKPADFVSIIDITAHKRSEDALKTEMQFTEDVINTTSDTIFLFEPETGKAVRWNKAFNEVSGYSDDEIATMKAPDSYYNEEDMARAAKASQKLMVGGDITFDMSIITKDGRSIPYEYNGKLFTTSDHRKLIVSYGRDISERKEAERKIKESEEKYRTLIENIPQRIFLKDKNSVYISCNNNYAMDLKIKADKIIGKTDYDFYPKELADKYKADDKRIMSTGEAEELDEFDIINSKERYVRTIKTPIRDNRGKITGLIGIFWDITERKEAEEEISNLAKFPAENPNPVLRVNKEKVIYINQTGQNFFNINVGAKIPIELYDIVQLAFKENITKTFEMERANKIYSFDIAPIQESGYANIYGNDITERKEAEQKIKGSEKKYKDAFNRANFYKDLFVHDINNIMQVINSSAELISYQSDQIEQTIDIDMITNMIKKQVMRAKKLVQSVNTLSELENNEKPIQPTEVCVLMKNTFNYINIAYQERNLNIQFEYFSKQIYAMANDGLQDVFDNILINSVKYTIKDAPEIFVKISKEKKDKNKYIKIEFIDNGIGIEDDRKNIIFKRGHREFKGQKGMGLGLSLVKKIIKKYNGKIWVEDRVKDDHTQGSNFILLIPQST